MLFTITQMLGLQNIFSQTKELRVITTHVVLLCQNHLKTASEDIIYYFLKCND